MQGLTADLKERLQSQDDSPFTPRQSDGKLAVESVYDIATRKGRTLREYVLHEPSEALYYAEKNVASWNQILTESILTGKIVTDYGMVKVNKNIADLIKLRLQQANVELEDVRRTTARTSTGSKKDQLLNTLYNKALEGDMKAMSIVYDRVEGRVGDKEEGEKNDVALANIYKIMHSLFDKQIEVLNSGSGTKICCCSRRAGKSHLAVSAAIMACLATPNTTVVYIGETQRMAEKIFDKAAKKLIDKANLRDTKGNTLNWKKLDNGSEILIRGLSNTKDPDAIRGFNAKVIIIDEFFHLKSELLEYLQREVLEPMQLDYAQDYKLIFIGTPPKERKTYGEMVWKTYNVAKYEWTWKDNPYIKNGEEYLARLCREKGIDISSPFILREYRGQWIYESDYLLFPSYYTYNAAEAIPTFDIEKVSFGIDYGTNDATAVIGVAWDTNLNRGYVFFEKKFNVLSTPQGMGVLQHLKNVVHEAWTLAFDLFPTLDKVEANKRIAWSADTNGSSQVVSQELHRDVRIMGSTVRMNINDAHRTDQPAMWDKMRDLLRTSALLLPEAGPTSIECELTVLKRDDNGNPTHEIDHKTYHPDILDALRYSLWSLVGGKNISTQVDVPEHVTYGGALNVDFEISDKPIYTKAG